MAKSTPYWTIAELGELVARALSQDYSGQTNGQVRDVPDQRTIRYYTTLGLLDAPIDRRGRTALYGRRHLLQLVAIKRMQAAGHTLGEIQQQLLGLSPSALNQLAQVPTELESLPSLETAPQREEPATERPAGAFWQAPPAPVPSSPLLNATTLLQTLHSIRLSEDSALLLTGSEPPSDETIKAIQQAAEPLLQFLETHRLIQPRHERGI